VHTVQFAFALGFGIAIIAISTASAVFARRILGRRAKVLSQYPSWALIPYRVLFLGSDPLAISPWMVLTSRLFGYFGIAIGLLVVALTVFSEYSKESVIDLHKLFSSAAQPHGISLPRGSPHLLPRSSPDAIRSGLLK
jgi:hypothetical protein